MAHAHNATSRDMHLRITYGDLIVHIIAEGVSYAPDVLDDMQRNAIDAFAEAVAIVNTYELATLTTDDELDDDTDDE